ncbi:diaminopimelate decarboxylase [Micrococcales bacterium 31B]|nr:diaminopimelate decarboxylase [Micrococcales bacterium 31B]
MRAHEAGALHGQLNAPSWLQRPTDVNDLLPGLWPQSVRRGSQCGILKVGNLKVTDIAEQVGTPAYVIDEADFRARARAFKTAFDEAFSKELGGPVDVYYAGKAFICTEVVRWVRDEGLNLDVCSGGELAVALRAGMPGERIGLHGNNKSDAEILRALEHRVGRIVVDSLAEIEQVARLAERVGVVAPVMLRTTVGVEAHTHEFIATAHEDQKFGLSLASGAAFEAARRVGELPALKLLGLHSHIGSQIFEVAGFEVAARRLLALYGRIVNELGLPLGEVDLGGGYGIMYNSTHVPLPVETLAKGMADIVAREIEAHQVPAPVVSIEPGRAIVGPSTFTVYTVGITKDVTLDGGQSRRYISVDGGMSDNIRTALYDADYSATLANRRSSAEPRLSRVVGKHCESGDIIVKDEFLPADVGEGDLIAVPATGAYCRSLASNYNHALRPPVVAVKDNEVRTLMRRETEDDLMALDVG